MMIVAYLLGLITVVGLIVYAGFLDVLHALLQTGWATLWIALFHVLTLILPAWGWRLLAESKCTLWLFIFARLVREAVNNLIPVAQVGGEVAGARILWIWGIPVKTGAASIVADLTVETAAQIFFTVLGLGLLAAIGIDSAELMKLAIGLSIATVLLGGFYAAQRFGLFRLFDVLIAKLAASSSWESLGILTGLHEEVGRLYRRPRRVLLASTSHFIGWVVGAGEIWIGFNALGVALSPIQAVALESLVQGVRSAGFFVPMGLGIQEGGYVASAMLFGIAPETALAVALMKRARDLVLGAPAILLWQLVEGRRLSWRAGGSK